MQDRPAAAPVTPGPFVSDWQVVKNPSFPEAIAAVSNLLFAFSGTPSEFATLGFAPCHGGLGVREKSMGTGIQ